jgi:hypothetical protein
MGESVGLGSFIIEAGVGGGIEGILGIWAVPPEGGEATVGMGIVLAARLAFTAGVPSLVGSGGWLPGIVWFVPPLIGLMLVLAPAFL